MAIEKVEGKKFEATPATLIQLGSAALLVVLALVFGWLAFSRWRFKTNLVEGYRAHDSRNLGQARTFLRNAMSWREDHPGPPLLLAKMACEAGETGAAEPLYQKLRAMGYDRPQVRVGAGVLALRKALAASDPKEINRLVGLAMAEFKSAGADTPEGEIGLGHCELVLSHKLNETTRTATARTIFGRVKTALESKEGYRRQITREGLLDFYAGLGKAAGSGAAYDVGAVGAYTACAQYAALWEVPQKSMVAVEGLRFARWRDPSPPQLAEAKADALKGFLAFNNRWRPNAAVWNKLKEQWMSSVLAASMAYARAGMEKEFVEFLELVTRAGGFTDRVEPYQAEAVGRSILALRESETVSANERSRLIATAFARCDTLLPRLKAENDPKNEWRARTLNMMGAFEAWRAANQRQPTVNQRALDRFNEAVKLAPDHYVYNRNAALILFRQKKPLSAYQQHLDKARAAATGDYAKDFDELLKVVAGN